MKNKRNRYFTGLISSLRTACALFLVLIMGLSISGCYLTAFDKEEEVEFSSDLASGTDTFVVITAIQPEFTISTLENYLSPSDVVCRCETESGETVWLYISTYDYKEHFDKYADFTRELSLWGDDDVPRKVWYMDGRTIHGTVKNASEIAADLPQKTANTVIYFKSAD